MNLVDCYVTRVLSEPEHRKCEGVEWWEVLVEYDSWGGVSESVRSFPTFEQAYAVTKGYHFLA